MTHAEFFFPSLIIWEMQFWSLSCILSKRGKNQNSYKEATCSQKVGCIFIRFHPLNLAAVGRHSLLCEDQMAISYVYFPPSLAGGWCHRDPAEPSKTWNPTSPLAGDTGRWPSLPGTWGALKFRSETVTGRRWFQQADRRCGLEAWVTLTDRVIKIFLWDSGGIGSYCSDLMLSGWRT